MSRKPYLISLALIVSVACSSAPTAQSVLADATAAMGAATLNSIEYSGTGLQFALGQSPNPDAPWPKFNAKSYTRAINYEIPQSRQVLVRTQAENPPHGGGNQPIIGDRTETLVATLSSPWEVQMEIWITPHGFLKGAAANNATLTQPNVLSFTVQEKYKVNGYLNPQNQVEKVETWIDNPVLGDMLVEATYSGYKDFGGVQFPAKIVVKQGGYAVLDLDIADVKPNAPVTIAALAAPAPVAVTTEKVADGVWYLTGGSHHSAVIEFNDHLAVVEGPQSEARASAVIAEAKKLVPNKPIRYLVNTHHHWDHAGGLRPFVAEGASIVTHAINQPYYEKNFALPHTLNPDRLAVAKTAPKFETLTDKKLLTDGVRVMEVHHVLGSGHNDGIILAYLPKERILIEADLFTPPADAKTPPPDPRSPFALNLGENLTRLKLDYQTVLPLHGRRSDKAELLKFATAK